MAISENNRVVRILMERDELMLAEAIELVEEAQAEMYECNYDPEECEGILADTLGLELDYLFDLL